MEVSKEKMESLLQSHSQESRSAQGVGSLKWVFTFLPEAEQSWSSTLFESIIKARS